MKKVLIISETANMLIPSIEKLLKGHENLGISFHSNITFDQADLIFMDYSLVGPNGPFPDALKHIEKLAIIATLIDHEQVNTILYETGVRHLFGLSGLNSLSDIRDFIVYWFQNKKWTADTFVSQPIKMTTHKFTTSLGVQDHIQELLAGHDFSHCFDGIENYLTHILDEALSNALFNAPVDENGQHLYRNKNRAEVIHMTPGKEPIATIYTDPKKIVISVKDFYGSLSENEIFDYLPKGEVRDKSGGAGIGMYLIFKYAHKYIINVVKGKMTENLIIIENDKRFKSYDLKEKSFHFFVE